MASSSGEDTRALIVRSLFSRKAEDGTLEETLVSYLRVKEDDGHGSLKTRYLFLAVTRLGECMLHKGKSNSNGTFSRGKTWRLSDMRTLEQIGPRDFALTMTIRRYHWNSDSSRDQHSFLASLLKAYRSVTGGSSPQVINFTADGHSQQGSTSTVSSSSHLPPPSSVRDRAPQRSHPAMASSASLVSSTSTHERHDRDLAPPRTTGERSGSFSSMDPRGGNVAGSVVGGSEFRQRLGSSGSRERDAQARPSASPAARYNDNLGPGRPPPRRDNSGNSDDRSLPPSRARPAQARRPSAASEAPEIPPVVDLDDDPYGGITDEVLTSPRQNGRVRESVGSPEPTYTIPAVTIANPDPVPLASPPAVPTITTTPTMVTNGNLTQSPVVITPVSTKPTAPSRAGGLAPPGATRTEATPREGQKTSEPMRRRVSFVPPPLTTAYSRDVLLTQPTGLLGADVMSQDEEEAADAIMANVEELIEGFDWTAPATGGDSSRKGPDAIEQRLLDELAALENANIHAFLESDDRVDQVLAHIDEALRELDGIDIQLTEYRMQLNAVTEDIAYIEGQNRGLQVQTSNQRALLALVQQLLQITDVPKDDLARLQQTSPNTPHGVSELEQSAASLYKALMASRDTANEVAATVAHLAQYEAATAQFTQRMVQYLDTAFDRQSEATYADTQKRQSVVLQPHVELGKALMGYEGIVLFIKDMDEERYKKLCLNYITTISKLHQKEMRGLLMTLKGQLGSTSLSDASFVQASQSTQKPSGITATVTRSKTVKRGEKAKTGDKKATDATRRVADMYATGVSEVVKQIVTEDDFIAAFLHLGDTESTFADYMELDTYFRRQASRHASHGLSASLTQLARSVMELMFGFVDGEMRLWVDASVEGNPSAIVGIIATTEQLQADAQMEGTSLFVQQLFDKQLGRQRKAFDAFVNDQVKNIDGAKTTVRKRRGVFYFVRHFPVFVERIECQLDSSYDSLDIRKRVNNAYERVAASVLGSLQHVSKVVGAEVGAGSGEGKGQLYFHVVMIENLHSFVDEVAQVNAAALAMFVQRARGLYDENMKAYIKMMLRRGFSRLMGFFDGVERQLKTTPPNEVNMHSAYSRSSLKKVLKDTGSKDMKKAVEAMARRVDKHFNDDESGLGGDSYHGQVSGPADAAIAALMASVWREITAALSGEVERAQKLMASCYSTSGLALEFGTKDVEAVCQRAWTGRG
ncbi:hypothetical protein CspeluHIS016_0505300 [Cutaneotrichosporon spelunceum]|uniref:Exocyst complex component Sec3 PIP2-binding N-terminal domain-containing protein n=1 Tax=Cutaneotrichosporon spelunceum TaxID=1672016 RepID=A0AAD3TX50_9TREE|nr:hypothetical protein CspeluHIS016_0505300 [Cutaneotrichosporon spelunceum]